MDLNEAIQNSNTELVEALLHDGADPNKVDDFGLVPLLWAKSIDSASMKKIVEDLLFYGADPNMLDSDGIPISQLDWSPEIKEIFDNFKPNSPDEIDQEGSSNLMIAASDSNLGLVRKYLKTIKKVDYRNPQGHSALLYAILFGSPEVMKELLLAGANLDLPDTNDNTPRSS
jgi:ankyrin repeat protein